VSAIISRESWPRLRAEKRGRRRRSRPFSSTHLLGSRALRLGDKHGWSVHGACHEPEHSQNGARANDRKPEFRSQACCVRLRQITRRGKGGHLRKACSFTTANLLITIAKDSATPEEVLKCLGESVRGMCRSGESRYAHRNSRGNEQVNRPSEIALRGAGVAKTAGWRNELQSKLAQGSPRGL